MTNYFNPNDLFELAKNMDDSNNSESLNRTILNRCYYSCYLRIKDECYRNRKGIDEHIHHNTAFYKVNKKNKKLGGYINRLYAARLVADYSLNSTETYKMYRQVNENFPKEFFGEYYVDVNIIKEQIKTAQKFHDFMDQRR